MKFGLGLFQLGLYQTLRSCYRNPKKTLFACLLLIAFAAAKLPSARYVLTADDMQEDSFPSQHQLKDLQKSFDESVSSLLTLTKQDATWTEVELCRIRQFFEHEAMANSNIKKMDSTLHLRKARGDRELFGFPLILNMDCSNPQTNLVSLDEIKNTPMGFLYTSKANEVSVHLSFTEAESFKYGSFDPTHLEKLKHKVQAELLTKLSNVTASWFGNADYMQYVLEGIQSGTWVNFIFCLVIILLLRLGAGTWRAGFYYVLTLLVTAVLVYGLKTAAGSPIDALSDSLFLMIGVAGLEDFVFLSYFQSVTGASWKKSYRKLVLASFFTSVTTAMGFGSLLTSEISSIRELGTWAGIGAMLEWAVIFIFLPAFLLTIKASKSWVNVQRSPLLKFFQTFSLSGLTKRSALLLLLIYPLALLASFFVNANDSYLNLFPPAHELRVSHNHLLAERDWGSYFSVVFENELRPEKLKQQIAQIKTLPNVRFVESGQTNFAYLQTLVIPDQWDLLKTEYFYSTAYERYKDKQGRERVIVYADTTFYQDLLRLKSEIETLCQENRCFVAGSSIKTAQLSQAIPATLSKSELMSALIVFALIFYLALAMGQVRNIGALLLGAGWAPALMTILVTLIQLPVNFLTCIFGSVLIGLAGDSAVQFLLLDRKKSLRQNIHLLSGATFQCAAIMGLASLLFSISYFAPPRIFGFLLLGGLAASVLGEVWISGALVKNEE